MNKKLNQAGGCRRAGWCLWGLLCWLAGLITVQAQSIEETRWGFKNTVVANQMNLLSVRLFNATPEPYEGMVTLAQHNFRGQVGAEHVLPVFLSPNTERWVQFYVFAGNGHNTWHLKVGKGQQHNGSKELPRPTLGAPVRVFLANSANSLENSATMSRFPDDLFPTSVSGLDGLHSLVLAHAPEWSTPRRQALRDWVYSGGILHVYQDQLSAFPEFLRELDFINDVKEREVFGSGLVVKHAATRKQVSESVLNTMGYTLPKAIDQSDHAQSTFYKDINQLMLLHLRKLVLPEHHWLLILFFAVVYLILIGPLNYILAKKWKNHFKTIGFFMACMLGFSAIFALAGRRGFGERSAVHSLSYVRPLENGFCDVTSWNHLFSTKGRNIALTNGGKNRIFATCEEDEKVRGRIVNGPEGVMMLDMPIFSSAQALSRSRLPGGDLGCNIEAGRSKGIEELLISVGEDFPEEVVEAFFIHQGRVGDLEFVNGQLRMKKKRGGAKHLVNQEMQRTIQQIDNAFGSRFGFRGQNQEEDQTVEERHRVMFYALIESILHTGQLFSSGVRTPEPPDMEPLHLFVIAPSPPGLNGAVDDFENPDSFMLLHQDLYFEPAD